MSEKNFFLLVELAKQTKLNNSIEISTIQLSKQLNISQQSISRKLQELEQTKLITKNSTPKGSQITVTEKGKQKIQKKFLELEKILKQNKELFLEGTIKSGLGEGKYYTSLQGYKKQFKEKLGYHIYPGTLNIETNQLELKRFLQDENKIIINGFKTKERTFGDIICYPVKINNQTDGAIIIPKRSIHPENTIELISSIYLRKKFNLKDGDKLKTNKAIIK